MSDPPIRTETEAGVRSIILARPERYNTITPELRDALAAAIDGADADPAVRVMLLRADGPAFCAGYGLDWSTEYQAGAESEQVWDSAKDYRMMSTFVEVYLKFWYAAKPTIAAVQGWCIAGGTDMVLCTDLIVAGENAVFGYPPSRYGKLRPPRCGCTVWDSSRPNGICSPATRFPHGRRRRSD